MRVLPILTGLAALTMVLAPLRSDLASWAWSWWLLAGLVAWVWGPRRHLPDLHRIVTPAALCLLVACLIDAVMGAWHQEGWIIMRQDGKVLLMLPIVVAVLSAMPWNASHSGATGTPSGRMTGHDLRETLAWALGLQMVVAAAVAVHWPRAWLPATSIPWATAVALGMAVLAPMMLGRDEAAPDGAAWRTGLALAVAVGAVAVVLSRSRAAWVILPWLMLLVVVFARRRVLAGLAALASGAALLVAGLWYDSLPPVQVASGVRMLDLLQELGKAGRPDAATSVGSRLLLWQAARDSLWAHPLAGRVID